MADATKLSVGFVGLGIMGEAMARNLLKSGLFSSVTVWNRTLSKCDALVAEGALSAPTPADVVAACDVTFGMLADPEAALAAVFNEGGVLAGISAGKGYVDMSTVDEATSTKIGEAVTAKGGKFVEGPVSGSKKPAIDGQLVIMGAGDKELYELVQPAFAVMGKKSFYLGATGAAARMKLVVNMVMGSMMGAFCEGMALADKSGLEQTALLEILGLGAMANPMFAMKGPGIMQRAYPPAFPLKHQQKDLRLALALGDALNQPLPVAAAANEAYKTAKALGRGDQDFAAVYEATQK
ncbi:putative oxidoreductase GLYR1 [Tetrabaena socialis]|uniref:Putative oxidoreductase GLYR1 n=1 Tax=Tetrabaena socialis TaxID=47790 RepID=A0A2J8AEM2_9CHLO|nr:putative oxidoreductase GLYR1 [Tetrabaena socialis]|eukprot:PNH10975.1 putative oxidoreductase GLYR1 [Tetrabaena socialis]